MRFAPPTVETFTQAAHIGLGFSTGSEPGVCAGVLNRNYISQAAEGVQNDKQLLQHLQAC